MLDILDVHLSTASSPEIHTMINQAYSLFNQYGLDDIDVGYTEILLMADNEGASESIIKICHLTSEYQDMILSQMQIDLVDEASVSEGNLVLRTLRLLEHTEHFDMVLQICEEVISPEEALAEILALVSGEEEERIIILIQSVGPALIATIKQLAQNSIAEMKALQDTTANKVYADLLATYYEAVDHQWLYIYERVQNGETLGKPYAQYHQEIIAAMEERQLAEPLPQKEYDIKMGLQLFAGALISSDGTNNPRAVVMNELTKTYADLDRITPIYLELDNLAIKFQSFQQGAPALTGTATTTMKKTTP